VIMTMDFGLLLLFDCVGPLWRLVGLLPTTQRTYGQTLCPDLTVEGQKTIRMYQGYTNVTVAHFSRARASRVVQTSRFARTASHLELEVE
jgi:hypothetical protein